MIRVPRDLLIVVGSIAFIGLLSYGSMLLVFYPATCSNSVISKSVAPDGKMTAISFQRNCGATTDFATLVSLLKNGEDLNDDDAIVFVADTNHGAAPDNSSGGPTVVTRWTSSRTLVVSYNSLARVFDHKTKFGPVSIEYNATLNR